MKLRWYQDKAINALFDYFDRHTGNPVVDTPTGSGKSVILAGFVARAVEQYPDVKITVLTHRKELIAQDAAAIERYWPGAPIGIWSAGLKKRQKRQITVGGIQSMHRHADQFTDTDLVIVDECHLISKDANTQYRRFFDHILAVNPHLKIIGLSATPYRADSGLITEGKGRIFTDIAYQVDVGRLIKEKYLSPLVPKAGKVKADLSALHTRAGDFILSELAERMDRPELVKAACLEMIGYGQDRKSWLVFCSGVDHADNVAECLRAYGIDARMICGETPAVERDQLLADFKAGKIQCLTNADLLTVGFDHPGVDLIGLLRPTQSIGLYVQIMGRGLRICDGKADCLVLDFAGNVMRHGPIDQISPKRGTAANKGDGLAPAKECPGCQALLHIGVPECPFCGHAFDMSTGPDHDRTADDSAIIGALAAPRLLDVTSVEYRRHKKEGKPPSMRVTYWCGLGLYDTFVPLEDPRPHVAKLATRWYWRRGAVPPADVDSALLTAKQLRVPKQIEVARNGRYWNVTKEFF